MSVFGYFPLFDLGVKLSKKTARIAQKGGSGLYEHVLSPTTGKAVGGITRFGDFAADQIMNHPKRALYLGGTGVALYSALGRAPDRFRNQMCYTDYRYI